MAGHPDEEYRFAQFSSEQLGKDYIKNARLKCPTWGKKFRVKSLLGGCRSAWIEWEDINQLQLDPVI